MTNSEIVYLTNDNWNDYFEYRTMYQMYYKNQHIGGVRIGRIGQTEDRPDIPDEFETLPTDYFSLGVSLEYYKNLKREGIYDYFVDGEGIDNDWMDDIARQMPLTYIVRPTWDICKLKDIGFREATAETEKVFEVLTPEEKENYKNSPMFMIEAVK